MPLKIVRNDIVNMRVDIIVNAANRRPIVGFGCDAGIHQKAGPELSAARKKIGSIPVGHVAVTSAFGLDARYVFHAVSPAWRGGNHREKKLLRQCYDRALSLAVEYRCDSIAFPLLSAGNHGFPKQLALQIAISAFSDFFTEHEMNIYLVVFNRDIFDLSGKLFGSVASYIDENYIQDKLAIEFSLTGRSNERDTAFVEKNDTLWRPLLLSHVLQEDLEEADVDKGTHDDYPDKLQKLFALQEGGSELHKGDHVKAPPMSCGLSSAPMGEKEAFEQRKSTFPGMDDAFKQFDLEDQLKQVDAGFSETLLRLIDCAGKKDSEIYKKANVDRKLFSKIRNNPNYRPSKSTALAFAIALELNVEETRDFLARAGYALSHSSKFDIIVEYFIFHRNYNIHEINLTLFEFDQSLLGA